MMTLLGMKIYCSEVFVLAWLVIWVPLTAGCTLLIRWIFLRRRTSKAVVASVLFAAALGSVPWWDVLYRSAGMARLCKEQAGLHIYKTVEVEGFAYGMGIKTASKYGFKFYEEQAPGHVLHWTMKDGKPVYESRPALESRYGIGGGGAGEIIEGLFTKLSSSNVYDLVSKEVLGELIKIATYPGVFDRIVLRGVGAESVSWVCGDEAPPGKGSTYDAHGVWHYTADDVVLAALKPKK